jgi:hypothetical protein
MTEEEETLRHDRLRSKATNQAKERLAQKLKSSRPLLRAPWSRAWWIKGLVVQH